MSLLLRVVYWFSLTVPLYGVPLGVCVGMWFWVSLMVGAMVLWDSVEGETSCTNPLSLRCVHYSWHIDSPSGTKSTI